jgi:hypothetical protein
MSLFIPKLDLFGCHSCTAAAADAAAASQQSYSNTPNDVKGIHALPVSSRITEYSCSPYKSVVLDS